MNVMLCMRVCASAMCEAMYDIYVRRACLLCMVANICIYVMCVYYVCMCATSVCYVSMFCMYV